MAQKPDDFREAEQRYRPGLERALRYFLEEDGEASRVTAGALEQAERQWTAIEGEANPLHLIGLAAVDQCELMLPRPEGEAARRVPTAVQVIRHLEWYDWERRIEALKVVIAAREASVREEGRPPEEDKESVELQAQLGQLIGLLFRAQLGLSDEDDNAGGGVAAPVETEPPGRGPGETRTFEDALVPARNP